MAQLKILPPAAKFLKKLKDKRLKALYQEAIDRILEEHTVGEAKTGDLAGVFVMTFTITRPIMNWPIP